MAAHNQHVSVHYQYAVQRKKERQWIFFHVLRSTPSSAVAVPVYLRDASVRETISLRGSSAGADGRSGRNR
jgi:hypothetical protein